MFKKRFIMFFLMFLFVSFVYADDLYYLGTLNVTSSINEVDKEYESTMGGKNVVFVSAGNSILKNCTFKKSGNSTYVDAFKYGTNAAIIVNNGSLEIDGGNVSTSGKHANGIFSYDMGIITINDVKIDTLSDNSSGIVSSFGGNIMAKNLSVDTNGISSYAISAIEDNSKITINGGTYETNGKNSPIVYSSGNVIINDAKLVSTASEGIHVEKNGNVTLNNVKVIDNNNIINEKLDSYRNIFLYNSEDDIGEVIFSSKDSSIQTSRGDSFVVTNTKAVINLEHNEINNDDGAFLVIRSSTFGKTGSNGGNVSLNMVKQKVKGKVVVDNISSLSLDMKDGSVLLGSVNNANASKNVIVNMSLDSSWSLLEDSYIMSLNNLDTDNNNIYSNGKYKLYVNGKEVKINNDYYHEESNIKTSYTDSVQEIDSKSVKNDNSYGFIIFIVIALGIGIGIYWFIMKAKANNSF